MKYTYLKRPLAIVTLAALAACSGGGGSGVPIPPAHDTDHASGRGNRARRHRR